MIERERRCETVVTIRTDGSGMPRCAEGECDRPAAVRIHVPWAEDREVCAAHARTIAAKDGVVAEPLEGEDERFP